MTVENFDYIGQSVGVHVWYHEKVAHIELKMKQFYSVSQSTRTVDRKEIECKSPNKAFELFSEAIAKVNSKEWRQEQINNQKIKLENQKKQIEDLLESGVWR